MKLCTPSALLLNALRQRVLNLSKKGLKPLLLKRKQLLNKEQIVRAAWSAPNRFRGAAWPWAALLLLAGVHSAQAQTTFTYNAVTLQTYTIPAGASGVKIEASGGGGGGGGSDAGGKGGNGAAGTTATGIYYSAPGTVLTVNVGGGGGRGFSSRDIPYRTGDTPGSGGIAIANLVKGGDGGRAGTNSGWSGGGGAGGGASLVLAGAGASTALLVAGGGGGGQGGANNNFGQNGAPAVNSAATPPVAGASGGTNTADGGGGGGSGGGCTPEAQAGQWHADGTPSLSSQRAFSGSACNAATVNSFSWTSTGAAGGIGSPGDQQAGSTVGTNGSVVITPLYPVLKLAKSAPSPSLRVGVNSVYTLTVTATAPSPFFRARVVDVLPSNLTYVSASGTGWTCSVTGAGGSIQQLTCDYSSITPSTSAAIAITALPTSTAEVVNRAKVDPSGGNPTNADACTGTNIPAAGCAAVTHTPVDVPAITKDFSPSSIAVGGTSVLTLTLTNPNTTAITLTSAFVDTFPPELKLANATFGGSCSGAPTGTAGGSTLTYPSGASIPGGSPSSCTITANVTSSTPGLVTNTVGAGDLKTSTGNNAAAASADLTVTAALPALSKEFAPSNISVGGISVLTITLSNPNATTAALSSALVDNLPAGMTVAPTPGATTTCSGTGTVTATAGASSITLPATRSIPGGALGTCTVTVNVTQSAAGTLTNTLPIGSLKTAFGNNAAAASATLTASSVTVTLKKTLVDTLGGLFNLSISGGSPVGGTNPANDVGDGGSTGAVTVTPGATITVAETAGTGTALANYTTNLSCVDGNGATVPTTGSGTSRTLTAPGAAATGNARNVTCTYTNMEVIVPVATPLLSCQSDANIFNTAYNGNPTGAPKASGFDNVWERGLSFGITAPTSWTAAAVATTNPGWNIFSLDGARWIAHQASTAHVGNVDLWYRYVFELQPGVIPANFRLKMDLYADNSIGGLYVNGVLQTVAGVPDSNIYNSEHFNPGTQYPVNLASNWQAGTNTIMLRTSSGAPALGFMAKGTASGLCDTKVTVSKLTEGGVGGPFTITGLAPNANGFAGQNLTTTVVGTPVSAPTQTLTTPAALLDLQEAHPTGGYALSGISCTGMGAGGTAIPNLTNAAVGGIPARSVRLDAAATAAGSNIACTFTNRTPTITFTKALRGSRAAALDQFTVAIRTGGVAGPVVSSTTNSTTLGTDASVTAGSGTTGAYSAAVGTTYTLTEASVGGATLANYNGLLSCVDTAGVQSTGLPTAAAFNPALGYGITPLAGTALSCTLTNTPAVRLSLQKALSGLGRVAASDQFTMAIRTGGAGGTIVNATTNSTTTGSGVNVATNTGTTGGFVGVPGTAYTFTEAMAPGSASTLAKYGQTLSCTNAGGTTNVSGWSSLPQSVTPVAGDNIACTVTNVPAALAVTGRVFLDHGLSGGTANDGVRNGGEVGQAGVTVRLTNCAAAVYSSSVTDGTGAYVFSVPAALSTGAALCVEQTNLSGRVSTGASVGSVALPTGSATAVGTTTYTYTRASTPDRIAFTWNGSGHAGLNFGDVNAGTFGANGSKTGQPGNTVVYPHTFTAGTAGTVNFEVSGAVPSPSLSGWTEKIFADVGCTGTLQAGAVQLFPPAAAPQAVLPGQQLCVIVQKFIPASAQAGYSNDATIQASFSYGNASPALPDASYTLNDLTNVGAGSLELKKEVRNVTQGVVAFGINNQAKSGETLEYRISYTNNAPAPISNLMVNDTTPVYTTFVASSTVTTPATLMGCTKNTPANPTPTPAVSCAAAQAPGGTGAVNWKFSGVLDPGGTGDVLFQVKVD